MVFSHNVQQACGRIPVACPCLVRVQRSHVWVVTIVVRRRILLCAKMSTRVSYVFLLASLCHPLVAVLNETHHTSKTNGIPQGRGLVLGTGARELETSASCRRQCGECQGGVTATTNGYNGGARFDHDEFWKTMRAWSRDNLVFVSEKQDERNKNELLVEHPTTRAAPTHRFMKSRRAQHPTVEC